MWTEKYYAHSDLCHEMFPWQRPAVGSNMKLTAVLLKNFNLEQDIDQGGEKLLIKYNSTLYTVHHRILLSANMLHMPRAQQIAQ